MIIASRETRWETLRPSFAVPQWVKRQGGREVTAPGSFSATPEGVESSLSSVISRGGTTHAKPGWSFNLSTTQPAWISA